MVMIKVNETKVLIMSVNNSSYPIVTIRAVNTENELNIYIEHKSMFTNLLWVCLSYMSYLFKKFSILNAPFNSTAILIWTSNDIKILKQLSDNSNV